MRPAVAIVIGLALSASAFGVEAKPSEQVLAEMGLSGLQILSDSDAMAVRGAGFDGFATLHSSIKMFHRSVKEFHKAKKDFHKQVKDFHKMVKKFDRKISKMKHHKPHGMKPPKMNHSGKTW
jgi:hypothetical protein